MAQRTTVHLLRHGEVFNPEKILYGRLPGYRLSDRGRAMADRVAGHLAGRDITLVVASPLQRAQETATPIAAALGLDILTDERVVEAANYLQGRRTDRSMFTDPRVWGLFVNPLRPSWGEKYTAIADRMTAAVEGARRHAEGHEAVVVSHQLPIWTLRSALEGRRLAHDPRRRECSLASLTSLTYDGGRLLSIAYSEPAADLVPAAEPTPGA